MKGEDSCKVVHLVRL